MNNETEQPKQEGSLNEEPRTPPLAEWAIQDVVHNRSRRWYMAAIAIFALALLYAIMTSNFLFALIIIMTAVIYYIQIVRPPETTAFAIYNDGIALAHRFTKWKEIKNFWILYDPPEVKKLYFSFKSPLRPFLSIPLDSQNPIALRKLLVGHLEEDLAQEEEPASEQWEKILKL
ncbi:MAG TPA: hypothetical protein VJC11_00400 [Patescibacteria group bacterium]|nr:hypothetical protein [Patescibacteria group bacterium]